MASGEKSISLTATGVGYSSGSKIPVTSVRSGSTRTWGRSSGPTVRISHPRPSIAGRSAQRAIQPDQGALARCQSDVADLDFLRPRVGSAELGALDELAQDDPHLVFGEGGADAAAYAAAEGNPGVVVGLAFEEALRPALLRVGEEVLAVVQGGDRRHHEAALGQLVAADLGRRLELAGDVDDHRPRPQRLPDRGVEVLILAGVDRLAQLGQHPGRAQ